MIVISDTSVVTSLIQIDRLSLLQTLYGPVLIPEAVHRELCCSHESLPGFLEVRQVLNRQMVTRLKEDLDLAGFRVSETVKDEAFLAAGE